MDGFLGIGGPELLLVFVIAMVALGPRRMAGTAFRLGRALRALDASYRDLMDGLRRELDALDAPPARPAAEPPEKPTEPAAKSAEAPPRTP